MRAWVQAANGPCGLECILEFFFLMIDKNRQTQTYTMPCPCQNVAITGPGGLGASAQKARHVHRQHWPTRPPPPTVRGAWQFNWRGERCELPGLASARLHASSPWLACWLASRLPFLCLPSSPMLHGANTDQTQEPKGIH